MIKASKVLIDFIEAQNSLDELAEEVSLTKQTLYNVKNGDNVSSDVIAKLLERTGFEVEKAFDLK